MSLALTQVICIIRVSDNMSKTKIYPLELEKDLHKKLKIRAVQEDRTLKELMYDALEDYLDKQKRN